MSLPIYNAPTPEEIEIQRRIKLAEQLRSSMDPMASQMVSGHYVGPSWTQGLANMLRAYSASRSEHDATDLQKKYSADQKKQYTDLMAKAITQTPKMAESDQTYFVGPDNKEYASKDEAYKAIGYDPTAVQTQGMGGTPIMGDVYALNPDGTKSEAPVDFVGGMTPPENTLQEPNIQQMTRKVTKPTGEYDYSYNPKALMAALLQTGDPRMAQSMLPMVQEMTAIQKLDGNNDVFGKVMPGDYTPDSLAKFAKTKDYASLVPTMRSNSGFGNVNPGQFTPESLAAYAQTHNYGDLVPRFAPQKIDTGATVGLYNPNTAQPIATPLSKQVPPQDLPSIKGAQAGAEAAAKAQVGRQFDQPQAELALSGMDAKIKNLNSKIDEAIGQADGWTTGFIGNTAANIPGTKAHDLAMNLDSIKAQLGFKELQDMRNASPTGGALGQVTERENILLQSAWESVAQSQSLDQFKRNLANLKTVNENALKRAEAAYKAQFGRDYGSDGSSAPASSGKVRKYNPATGRIE